MFARKLAWAIALIAGLIGSQGPEFAQQYRERLGGALDELKQIIAAFDAEAAGERLTPPEAVGRLEQNGDPLARERGHDMAETIARADRLQEELDAMQSAPPLQRLYVFAKDFDPGIAQRTLDNYEPAAPLSIEAVAAAVFAAFLGWAATHLVALPFRRSRSGTRDPSLTKTAR
jgi:hypothetical protein